MIKAVLVETNYDDFMEKYNEALRKDWKSIGEITFHVVLIIKRKNVEELITRVLTTFDYEEYKNKLISLDEDENVLEYEIVNETPKIYAWMSNEKMEYTQEEMKRMNYFKAFGNDKDITSIVPAHPNSSDAKIHSFQLPLVSDNLD